MIENVNVMGVIVENYEEIRIKLLHMLEDLDERLGKITRQIQHADEPLAKDSEEQATERENDEVLDALGNATRSEREKVKQALARIDSGQYGICVECGEPIQKERLKVLPYSTTCIRCAEKASKK